jgi:hypothetical protein
MCWTIEIQQLPKLKQGTTTPSHTITVIPHYAGTQDSHLSHREIKNFLQVKDVDGEI